MKLSDKMKEDILKAEIASLFMFFNKTNINFWQSEYGYFNSYPDHNFDFANTIESTFLKDIDIEWNGSHKKILDIFLNEDWRKAKTDLQTLFTRGCENVNSGIDKGSPKDDKKIEPEPYICNAFGTCIKEVEVNDLDKRRECFLKQLEEKLTKTKWVDNNDWISIRNYIHIEIKRWFTNLLSDSRFPANDVTLWDQVYMTASMFKAVLAQIYMKDSLKTEYIKEPQKIKWQIFGVQYDKLKLAEKGMKPAFMQWYRDRIQKVDKQIQEYLETDLCVANEIYRDETGIYFLFPQYMGREPKDLNNDSRSSDHLLNNVQILEEEYREIEKKINSFFEQKFDGEINPAFFLTKASRGTMNLTYLLDNAKKLFLYSPYFGSRPNSPVASVWQDCSQICPVCRIRPVENKKAEDEKKSNYDDDLKVCEECGKRKTRRREDWWEEQKGETIWLDELQDKNSRIALITLRFELMEWLNGKMLSTMVNRDEVFYSHCEKLTNLLIEIHNHLKSGTDWKEKVNNMVNRYHQKINECFICFFDKLSIQAIFKAIKSDAPYVRNLAHSAMSELMSDCGFTGAIWRSNNSFLANHGIASRIEEFFHERRTNMQKMKDASTFAFFENQIISILLDRSNGSHWEEFIKAKIPAVNNDKLKEAYIDWDELDENQIKTMASILLQFLLRKNPSPARLRRIWESTESFLNIVESEVIKNSASKRIVLTLEDDMIEDGEWNCSGLVFLVRGEKAYLLTSIEKARSVILKKRRDEKADSILSDEELNEIRKIWHKGIRLSKKSNDDTLEKTVFPKKVVSESFKSIFSILEPTPISWQFAVPASKVNYIIQLIREKYKEQFHYVYGKLPLHIGVVVQNYKSPLYSGIKALRNIRRELHHVQEIETSCDGLSLKAIQKDIFPGVNSYETANKAEKYYSLYIKYEGQGDYEFYFPPSKEPKNLSLTSDTNETQKFAFFPNTIDFEYLDCNVRRNDIFYESGRRKHMWRQQRPYAWEEWEKFVKFGELFKKSNQRFSQLHNLVTLFYSLLQDWKGNDESIKSMAASAVINTIKPKGLKDDQKHLAFLFDTDDWKNITNTITISNMKRFIDCYDYWHTALKEV
jgi:CRISPR-associated Csx11 family protein